MKMGSHKPSTPLTSKKKKLNKLTADVVVLSKDMGRATIPIQAEIGESNYKLHFDWCLRVVGVIMKYWMVLNCVC
jgi:hypothetical protein